MNWLRRIMMGRYGSDQLNMAMLVVSLLLLLLDRLIGWRIFWIVSFVLLVLCYLRIFSRSTSRRWQENQRFLQFWNPLQTRLRGTLDTLKDSGTHRYFKCPSCGQKVRVPRNRGRINITCPKCGLGFIKKT